MTSRTAYKGLATVFAVGAAYTVASFAGSLSGRTVRTGLLFYALVFAASAAGLWRGESWGRSLALITALTGVGFGALSLIAALGRRDASTVPAVVLAASVVVLVLVARTPLPPESRLPHA